MESGGGAAASGGRYDQLRQEFVSRVEVARDSLSELELAVVIDEIGLEAKKDLNEQTEALGVDDADLIVSVNVWASMVSYAVARFYFEGPESLFKGGYDRKVVESLQSAASKFRPFLERAVHKAGADSFSIAIGFPWGVSVGLNWTP